MPIIYHDQVSTTDAKTFNSHGRNSSSKWPSLEWCAPNGTPAYHHSMIENIKFSPIWRKHNVSLAIPRLTMKPIFLYPKVPDVSAVEFVKTNAANSQVISILLHSCSTPNQFDWWLKSVVSFVSVLVWKTYPLAIWSTNSELLKGTHQFPDDFLNMMNICKSFIAGDSCSPRSSLADHCRPMSPFSNPQGTKPGIDHCHRGIMPDIRFLPSTEAGI